MPGGKVDFPQCFCRIHPFFQRLIGIEKGDRGIVHREIVPHLSMLHAVEDLFFEGYLIGEEETVGTRAVHWKRIVE